MTAPTRTSAVWFVADRYLERLAGTDATAAGAIGAPVTSRLPQVCPDDFDDRLDAARSARAALAGAPAVDIADGDLKAALTDRLDAEILLADNGFTERLLAPLRTPVQAIRATFDALPEANAGDWELVVGELAGDLDPAGRQAAIAVLDADPHRRLDDDAAILAWLDDSVRVAADAIDGVHADPPERARLPECRLTTTGAGVMYYSAPIRTWSGGGRCGGLPTPGGTHRRSPPRHPTKTRPPTPTAHLPPPDVPRRSVAGPAASRPCSLSPGTGHPTV